MGPVRIRHSSHHFATQSSHFVNWAGWQTKMVSIEFNAHGPHVTLWGARFHWHHGFSSLLSLSVQNIKPLKKDEEEKKRKEISDRNLFSVILNKTLNIIHFQVCQSNWVKMTKYGSRDKFIAKAKGKTAWSDKFAPKRLAQRRVMVTFSVGVPILAIFQQILRCNTSQKVSLQEIVPLDAKISSRNAKWSIHWKENEFFLRISRSIIKMAII